MAPARGKRSTTRDLAAAAVPGDLSGKSAPSHVIARLVPLDPGLYTVGLASETGWLEPLPGFAVPAVQVSAPPHQGSAIEITDSSGRPGSWLGGRRSMLLIKSPAGGGAALVTAYLARDPDSVPLELEIRRVGGPGAPPAAASATTPAPVVRLRMGGSASAQQSSQPVGLEIVAHIRGHGDVRFSGTPQIGRLGPGLWIEALTIVPHDRSAAAAIEYKGLTASGAETPWLGSGSPCGTTGRGMPLIGFAVRQKAVASGPLFDCEYTGFFQSGATAGPARNGAPCRSATDNDPLEGLQLRITPRPTLSPRPRSR